MEFPDKSDRKQPEPAKRVPKEAVVTGVVKAKRPATRRLLDYTFAESPKTVAGSIGKNIVVPRIKAGIEEALVGMLSGILWGGNKPMGLASSIIQGGTVLRGGGMNYQQISQAGPLNPMLAAAQANTARPVGGYQDLVAPTQEKAEYLLANVYDLLNQYRMVTVADLHEIAEITPAPGEDRLGWTNLDSARISKVREGFRLELPRPHLI